MFYETNAWRQFVVALPEILLLTVWVVWWLLAVDWRKMGPYLREGGWAPMLLIALIAAGAWSRIYPSECGCLGFVVLPNFIWQLGSVIGLVLVALFCGWLQGLYGWAPPEYALEPESQVHGDEHEGGQGGHH